MSEPTPTQSAKKRSLWSWFGRSEEPEYEPAVIEETTYEKISTTPVTSPGKGGSETFTTPPHQKHNTAMVSPTRTPFNVKDIDNAIASEVVYQEDAPNVDPVHLHKFRQHPEVRTRTVKVPVKAEIESQKITKKIIPEPKTMIETYEDFEEEEYFVTVQEKRTRPKTIWVPKTVQEEYMEPVQVRKTRKVPVIRKVMRTEVVEKTVEVPIVQTYVASGFRLDKVEDSATIEEEITETIVLEPRATGEVVMKNARDLGRVRHHRLNRHIGNEVFPIGDPTLNDISDDSDEEAPASPADIVWRTSESVTGSKRKVYNEDGSEVTIEGETVAAEGEEDLSPKKRPQRSARKRAAKK